VQQCTIKRESIRWPRQRAQVGTVIPSAFAVFKLMTNSNSLVVAQAGRQAFHP
jgi:hypothetical protein